MLIQVTLTVDAPNDDPRGAMNYARCVVGAIQDRHIQGGLRNDSPQEKARWERWLDDKRRHALAVRSARYGQLS